MPTICASCTISLSRWRQRSLDIGAATGRWPRTFAATGIATHGIDIARDAIAYATQKLTPAERAAGNPSLQVADALAMPFRRPVLPRHLHDGHLRPYRESRSRPLFRRVAGCCARGHLLISTWDIECRHQSYLSMYSLIEKG